MDPKLSSVIKEEKKSSKKFEHLQKRPNLILRTFGDFRTDTDNWGQSWPQTDRPTDRHMNSLTPYMGVCGFFSWLNLLPSLLASLAGDKLFAYKVNWLKSVKFAFIFCKIPNNKHLFWIRKLFFNIITLHTCV